MMEAGRFRSIGARVGGCNKVTISGIPRAHCSPQVSLIKTDAHPVTERLQFHFNSMESVMLLLIAYVIDDRFFMLRGHG